MWFQSSGKRRRGNEQGMTLPEVLISVVLLGTISGALFSSLAVIDKSINPTEARVAESGDIKFLQTYVPHDLNSATVSNTDPLAQPIAGQTLPGTNVLALTRIEDGSTVLTSYRYHQVGGRWALVRYESGNPMNGGVLSNVTVADELAAPPAGWAPTTSPAHAATIRQRVPGMILPVGADLEVRFKSGSTFTTGGTGLASEDHLPPFGFRGPGADEAPKSRCGGPITLVLDNSGSIYDQAGDADLKRAAIGFIDAFTGTPSSISIYQFSGSVGNLYPTSGSGYIDLRVPGTPEITAAKSAVNGLTRGGGTNWEAGLRRAFFTGTSSTAAARADTSALVVFLTDGDPNRTIASSSPTVQVATTQAVAQANEGRALGSRVIGVMVGTNAGIPASVARLKQVVGTTTWDGATPGNAAGADYFSPAGGSFAQLGGVFKAIMAGQCGGTVTVQKYIETSPGVLVDPVQSWWYSSEAGANDYEPDIEDSITFDYGFPNGTAKNVEVVEAPNLGFVLDRIECTSGGLPIAAPKVTPSAAGVPGVIINLSPNEAVACSFISRVAS